MNNFDPNTGQPTFGKPKVAAPINTRTFMYHKVRPAIVVEGVGATDADKKADVALKIKAKEAEGYRLTRFDGQHPHSNDAHRLDAQQRAAENGDKTAKAALEAKAGKPQVSKPPVA